MMMPTFCPLLLAALMRDVMLAMFSVSCFARWALMCISSAMVMFKSKKSRVTRGLSVHVDVSFWRVVSPACGASIDSRLTCAGTRPGPSTSIQT